MLYWQQLSKHNNELQQLRQKQNTKINSIVKGQNKYSFLLFSCLKMTDHVVGCSLGALHLLLIIFYDEYNF